MLDSGMRHIREIQREYRVAKEKVTQVVGEDRPGGVASEKGNYPDRVTNK